MSKDYYPQKPIKGTCLRVICCMYSVLFCFSYLYLKLLCFEKGGLISQFIFLFYILMSLMIIFVNKSYKFYVLFLFLVNLHAFE